MSEKNDIGYATISVKADTRNRVREIREERGVTTDELIKSLIDEE